MQKLNLLRYAKELLHYSIDIPLVIKSYSKIIMIDFLERKYFERLPNLTPVKSTKRWTWLIVGTDSVIQRASESGQRT